MLDRREFLQTLMASLPALLIFNKNDQHQDKTGPLLQKRLLGKTGESVTMLGLGGYHIGWTTERDAQETIETALAGGVRFFDTAESYNKGTSEIRYGKYVTPKYREKIFLMTKTTGEDAKTVQRHLDESLKRLRTDYLDLWQVHSIKDPDDVDARIENGVLNVFEQAKQAGKVRYIGFTGHRNPKAHLRLLERTAHNDIFDTCQMPVNVLDPSYYSFVKNVIPVIQKRKIALLAMKTLADGRFFSQKKQLDDIKWQTDDPVIPNYLTVKEALYFAWSLPVSVLITGAENAGLLKEKIELAKSFSELSDSARDVLIDKVAHLAQEAKIEYFKEI